MNRMLALLLLLGTGYAQAEGLCAEGETVAFSCGVGSKSLSVCGLADDTLSYRFGTPERVELEITAPIHFSRTAYSGGGEGNLTFAAGHYKYVVYSSISNGDWLADGGRDKIERAGVYVVKDDKLLADIPCTSYSAEHFIRQLPAHEEEAFEYYR
ncbi:MAG: hypothetical protein CMK78_08580 [Pseudomonadales bacterium]|nr:hypothetical protein [Pseudomonadales bacterium]